MRLALLTLLLPAAAVFAQDAPLKPAEFEPLTSLPWKKADATLEGTLRAIFREPTSGIRYPLLAEYLRTIPAAELSKAFDICIDLERGQTPDRLVSFFLGIWAQRNPEVCWVRTKALFHIVGIEDGWLGYDGWKERERITVQDRDAIQKSRFWITSSALRGFPMGVEQSSLPKKERVRIMREFANTWIDAFGSWPWVTGANADPNYTGDYAAHDDALLKAFVIPADQLRVYVEKIHPYSERAAVEIAMRRFLLAEPASAAEIIGSLGKLKWDLPEALHLDPQYIIAPTSLLLLWAKTDLAGMTRWTDSFDFKKVENNLPFYAAGLLMSRVEPAIRERWLARAKIADRDADFDRTSMILTEWAGWDPGPALAAAAATKNLETLTDVAIDASRGPFSSSPSNSNQAGLKAVKNFDLSSLPPEIQKQIGKQENWEMIMENWGETDIGGAARYGLDFLLRTDYAPRDKLLRFFAGEDLYASEDGMLDRTFCALRVWAVVRPKEMKTWIATLKDAEMQKALTWLLEHPWGTNAQPD